jgi:hypothetical protein
MINPWKMSEAELQAEIIERCQGRDLWVVRIAPERIAQRIADNKGFPDLQLIGPRGVLYRELKTCRGGHRLRSAQTAWKHRLQASGQFWDIWTPRELESGHIDACLAWLETPGKNTDLFQLIMARDT